jgi:hypothetical protein
MKLITAGMVAAFAGCAAAFAQETSPMGAEAVPLLRDGPVAFTNGVKGFSVHEWGVFSVYPNQEWANVDMAHEWNSLPARIYRLYPKAQLPYFGPVRKPVVYFHWNADTEPKGPVSLTVQFFNGRPVVWYPATTHPAFVRGDSRDLAAGQLRWTLHVRKPFPESAERPWHIRPLDVADGHWYARLRDVKADKVYSAAGNSQVQELPLCEEKFVYYDGVMHALRFLSIKKDATGALALDIAATTDLLDVFVVNREAGGRRLAVFDRLPPGKRNEPLNWREIPPAEWEGATVGEMTRRLVRAGLNEDEAAVAVDIWKPAFFDQEGMCIVYRLPQPAYDWVTRITLDPLPEKLVRVGLVHHPHAEPDLVERVRALIAGLRDATGGAAAEKKLRAYGGAALEELKKAGEKEEGVAARAKVQALIEEIDITAKPDFPKLQPLRPSL